jgi:hypothetical protein
MGVTVASAEYELAISLRAIFPDIPMITQRPIAIGCRLIHGVAMGDYALPDILLKFPKKELVILSRFVEIQPR